MSGFGAYAAYIEEQRRIRIQQEEERKRRIALQNEIDEIIEEIGKIHERSLKEGTSAAAHEEMVKLTDDIMAVRMNYEKDVDAAVHQARIARASMMEIQKIGQAKKLEKKMKIDEIKIEIMAEIDRAKSLAESTKIGHLKNAVEAQNKKLASLLSDHLNGFKDSYSHLGKITKELDKLAIDIQDFHVKEAERRYILKSLIDTMEELGFIVNKPSLNTETDQVTLQAVMPSGRKMLFRVGLKGSMEFDLDGYEGRECAKDLKNVLDLMVDKYSVKSEPPQYNWKNPDRISKGSKGFPGGGGAKTMKGGSK